MTADSRLRPEGGFERFASPAVHMTGIALAAVGAGMLAAAVVDAVNGGRDVVGLATPGVLMVLAGLSVREVSRVPNRLPVRSVFIAVAVTWLVVPLAASVPYVSTGAVSRFDDALFEAVAGFTTTNATLFTDLESLSPGLLFWRSLTQWIGGLGVIVLAVAVIPYLGAGGMSFVRSELPASSDYVAPRVRETARRLWGLYVAFTAVVTTAYLLGGMSPFDASTHAFTTVSTGGFSTRDGSLGSFGSPTLEWVATGAMFVAGVNVILVWRAVRGRAGPLLQSAELRAYGVIVVTASTMVVVWNAGTDALSHDAIRESVFSVVSLASTTGFFVADVGQWTQPAQAVVLLLLFVGAMTASTGGGPKVMRLLAAFSYARRELIRHLHPRLVAPVRVGRETLPEEVTARILGYYAVFLLAVVAGAITVASLDVDILTAVSASAASLSNIGPALGDVAPGGGAGYFLLDDSARAVLMALMVLGRVEIYPVLIGLAAVPEFLQSLAPSWVSRALTRRP